MGRLAAKAYPTKVVANLAEHTYVECAAGAKGWGCWGAKLGGRSLSVAGGSTRRADAIAQPDECGGITCYAINGVCHQAANRILAPANIGVDGALGYGASKWVFGVYGRPSGPLGLCSAPFDQHAGVSGDLDECADLGSIAPSRSTRGLPEEQRFRTIAAQTVALFARDDLTGTNQDARIRFQLAQAEILAMNSLEGYRTYWDLILNIQFQFESNRVVLEDELADGMPRELFPPAFNRLILEYQNELAEALPSHVYVAMMGSPPGESFVLCDPETFIQNPGPESPPRRGPGFGAR